MKLVMEDPRKAVSSKQEFGKYFRQTEETNRLRLGVEAGIQLKGDRH
jgi:hypothetical protein